MSKDIYWGRSKIAAKIKDSQNSWRGRSVKCCYPSRIVFTGKVFFVIELREIWRSQLILAQVTQ